MASAEIGSEHAEAGNHLPPAMRFLTIKIIRPANERQLSALLPCDKLLLPNVSFTNATFYLRIIETQRKVQQHTLVAFAIIVGHKLDSSFLEILRICISLLLSKESLHHRLRPVLSVAAVLSTNLITQQAGCRIAEATRLHGKASVRTAHRDRNRHSLLGKIVLILPMIFSEAAYVRKHEQPS